MVIVDNSPHRQTALAPQPGAILFTHHGYKSLRAAKVCPPAIVPSHVQFLGERIPIKKKLQAEALGDFSRQSQCFGENSILHKRQCPYGAHFIRNKSVLGPQQPIHRL